MEILSTLKLVIGGAAVVGILIAVAFIYYKGRSDYKRKVQLNNAKEIQKDAVLESKPKPTSNADRDSLRNGDF